MDEVKSANIIARQDDKIEAAHKIIQEARSVIKDAERTIVNQQARIQRLRMGLKRIADAEQADPVSRALAMTSLKNDDKAAGE